MPAGDIDQGEQDVAEFRQLMGVGFVGDRLPKLL